MNNKVHEKIIQTSADYILAYPYYSEFLQNMQVIESKRVPTAGVYVGKRFPVMEYNKEFIENTPQNQVNFLITHEIYHLLFDHNARGMHYDHHMANIAMDMIINSLISRSIPAKFADMPKTEKVDDKGVKTYENSGVYIPKEYTGKEIFEELYIWLEEKAKEEKDRRKQNGKGQSQNNGEKLSEGYGANGKNGEKMIGAKEIIDSLVNQDESVGQLDIHMPDEVDSETKKSIVDGIVDAIRNRGMEDGHFTKVLGALIKKKHDYLKDIKREISTVMGGGIDFKTFTRPNRHNDLLKGKKTKKFKLNVIQDVSGSMHGYVEKTMNYIYRNDIEVNLILADTKIQAIKNAKSKKAIAKVEIHGYGGTELMPAVNYVKEKLSMYPTLILSDGYTDELDLIGLKKVLILSVDKELPIKAGKAKQVIIKED